MFPVRVIACRVALWPSFAAFHSSSLTILRDGICRVIHSAFGFKREMRLPVSGFVT
jgi:hypothetical protein